MKIVGYQSSKLSVISLAICPARNSEKKEITQVNIIAVKAKDLLIRPDGKGLSGRFILISFLMQELMV